MAVKKLKKTGGHPPYVVVPNLDLKAKSSAWKSSKNSNLVLRAAEATRKKRDYKLISDSHGTFVVVRSKANGKIISKFKVDDSKKTKSVRKFTLKPKPGTISTERIFKAI